MNLYHKSILFMILGGFILLLGKNDSLCLIVGGIILGFGWLYGFADDILNEFQKRFHMEYFKDKEKH